MKHAFLRFAGRADPRQVPLPGRVALLAGVVLLLPAPTALAQIRPVAIREATLLLGDGRKIESGTVLFQGGAISGVGENVDVSMLAKKITAKGKFVTPGLIDVWSTQALRGAAAGRPTARAQDAFDRYAADDLEAALREGITAVYLPARTAAGWGGSGAVVRLQPGVTLEDAVLADNVALCAAVGAGPNQPALARVRTVRELRRALLDAQDYRKAREDYEEELKEYEKKLAERAKKDEPAKTQPAAAPKRDGGGKPPEPAKPEPPKGEKKDEKKDELKKPVQPPIDRGRDQLLKVLDGELRLRVEVYRPADILNVLDLAEEFNLALVLEGASGAPEVAERLKRAEVPVVLGTTPVPMMWSPAPQADARPDAAALLRDAGIPVYLGSGVGAAGEGAAPSLALRAARAVGYGLNADEALQLITSKAARFLGVEKKIGRLAPGLSADLVIWSDHPLAPGARVERVYIAGSEVYRFGSENRTDEEGGE